MWLQKHKLIRSSRSVFKLGCRTSKSVTLFSWTFSNNSTKLLLKIIPRKILKWRPLSKYVSCLLPDRQPHSLKCKFESVSQHTALLLSKRRIIYKIYKRHTSSVLAFRTKKELFFDTGCRRPILTIRMPRHEKESLSLSTIMHSAVNLRICVLESLNAMNVLEIALICFIRLYA